MERAEEQWEQEGPEEEEEEDEALQARKPRNQSNQTTTTVEFSNGGNCSKNNGGILTGLVNSALLVNGANDSPHVQHEVAEEHGASKNVVGIDDCDVDKLIAAEDEKQRSEYCVYYDADKGNRFRYESSVGEHTSVECSAPLKKPGEDELDFTVQSLDIENGVRSVINNQNEGNSKHENFRDYSLQPSETSFTEHNKSFTSYSNKAIESADKYQIRVKEYEVTELDVETVLKKQDTHDLYCPNCNSCITKRVILRKRKHRVRTSGEDAKRNKLETLIHSELDAITADVTNDQACSGINICLDDNPPPASNEYDREREPDVFRCLSCFSIFIPTGTGFKLFRMFGHKNKKENMQDSQNIATRRKNWFSSIFASDKGEVLTEQGTGHRLDVEENIVGALILPSNLDEPKGQTSSRQEANSHVTGHGVDMERNSVGVHIPSSKLNERKDQGSSIQEAPSRSQTFIVGLGNSKTPESLEGGDNILPSSMQGPTIHGKPILDVREKLDGTIRKSKGIKLDLESSQRKENAIT